MNRLTHRTMKSQSVATPTGESIGEAERVAREHLRIVATGDENAVKKNVTPDYWNHRSNDEPMEARQRGPAGLIATMRWLHRAFAEMKFEIHEALINGDRVALRVTFSARQIGPFVVHNTPKGDVTDAFPPTGKTFAVFQTHWFTIINGAVAQHDAVRDDLGMAQQLGWIPPKPIFIIKMLILASRERRATRQANAAKALPK